jgi:hypothetical protein
MNGMTHDGMHAARRSDGWDEEAERGVRFHSVIHRSRPFVGALARFVTLA